MDKQKLWRSLLILICKNHKGRGWNFNLPRLLIPYSPDALLSLPVPGVFVIFLYFSSLVFPVPVLFRHLSSKLFLWYDFERDKLGFIKENIDETIFMFAFFKCRKSDKGRN